MRWRNVPSPTKEAPVRIGLPQVTPRHITAPPQWIGGWAGCNWGRTGEWMPSAALSRGAAAADHAAAPVDRRLGGMHLGAHRGVDAVGADEQGAARLGDGAVGVLDQ